MKKEKPQEKLYKVALAAWKNCPPAGVEVKLRAAVRAVTKAAVEAEPPGPLVRDTLDGPHGQRLAVQADAQLGRGDEAFVLPPELDLHDVLRRISFPGGLTEIPIEAKGRSRAQPNSSAKVRRIAPAPGPFTMSHPSPGERPSSPSRSAPRKHSLF